MKKLLFFITIFTVLSCTSDGNNPEDVVEDVDSTLVDTSVQDTLDKQIISDYDMSTVDKKNSKEFKQNLVN